METATISVGINIDREKEFPHGRVNWGGVSQAEIGNLHLAIHLFFAEPSLGLRRLIMGSIGGVEMHDGFSSTGSVDLDGIV